MNGRRNHQITRRRRRIPGTNGKQTTTITISYCILDVQLTLIFARSECLPSGKWRTFRRVFGMKIIAWINFNTCLFDIYQYVLYG